METGLDGPDSVRRRFHETPSLARKGLDEGGRDAPDQLLRTGLGARIAEPRALP